MKKDLAIILSLSIWLLLTSQLCRAERDTLVVCLGPQPITQLNPALTSNRHIFVLYHNWGDTLLYRDPESRLIVPCLAESYQWVDDTTLEFRLRKDVRFHNGEPFDARAVAFSMQVLKSPGSLVSKYLGDFQKVDVLDRHTIRFRMANPVPTALEVIANIFFIYPPDYYQQAGKEGFGNHPIGTGPYRFISRPDSSHAHFEAYPDYFGGPKGKARISHLKATTAADEMIQMEALISGKADLVRSTNFYTEQLPFMCENPGLKIRHIPILRLSFLAMDAAGRSGVNFFKDKRVRMAVNHAINKEKIIRIAYQGYAERVDSVTTPLHFGHEPDVTRYPYNPAMSRKLLADAGYPNGFAVDFYAAVGESACQLMVDDLAEVGIRAKLHYMDGQWDRFYQKFLRGEFPLAFMTWGSYSIPDASAILSPFFLMGAPGFYDVTPELSGMIMKAGRIMDQKLRKGLFSRAQKMIADEALWVPICANQAISIMDKDLHFRPSCDEIDRYYAASWD